MKGEIFNTCKKNSKDFFYEGIIEGIGTTILDKCPFCGREHIKASPITRKVNGRRELQCRECAREISRVRLEEVLKDRKLQKVYRHFAKRKIEKGRTFYGGN